MGGPLETMFIKKLYLDKPRDIHRDKEIGLCIIFENINGTSRTIVSPEDQYRFYNQITGSGFNKGSAIGQGQGALCGNKDS